MQKVTVKIVDTDFVRKNLTEILSVADKRRIEKADRFKQENDRLLSLGAAYLMSKTLVSADFVYNENGKPYLVGGAFFSISHSGKYSALVTCADREVGVDIQKIDQKDLPALQKITGKNLPINGAFCAWSNKESFIKCIGENMSILKDAPDLPLCGEREFFGKKYYTVSTIYDGYSLSVTLIGSEPFSLNIEKIDKIYK